MQTHLRVSGLEELNVVFNVALVLGLVGSALAIHDLRCFMVVHALYAFPLAIGVVQRDGNGLLWTPLQPGTDRGPVPGGDRGLIPLGEDLCVDIRRCLGR